MIGKRKRLTTAVLALVMTLVAVLDLFPAQIARAAEEPATYLDGIKELPEYTQKVYDGWKNTGNYTRPSAEQILADYEKSSQYQKHPRIMITKQMVDNQLKPLASNSNDPRYKLYNKIKTRADNLYTWIIEQNSQDQLPKYSYKNENRMPVNGNPEKPAGGNTSDDFKYKIMVLGLAYQMSDDVDQKQGYAEAAWKLLDRVTNYYESNADSNDNFKDINPWHNLDFGTFSQGLAIGYDRFYDAWTAERKERLQNAIVRLCFQVANESYAKKSIFKDTDHNKQKSTLGTGHVKGVEYNHNHNSFVNSGIIMAALALIDEYPETASTLCQDAFHSMEKNLNEYYPSGLSNESPQYWLFSMDNFSMIFSTLESALEIGGDSDGLYGLDVCPAMNGGRAMMAVHALESDVGTFTFGDTEEGKVTTPGELYFYKHYNLHGYNQSIFNRIYNKNDDYAALVEAFIWCKVEADDVSGLSRDWGPGKGQSVQGASEFATFRSDFGSKQSFVGIKAGKTLNDFFVHLDQGSFVFHSQGVKWAVDLGKDKYSLTGYYDKVTNGRWKIFRLRPDGHNTLLISPNPNDIGYELGKQAPLSTECSDSHAKAVVDLTNLVSSKASKARRGFLLTDDRRALVVRDEVTLKQAADVYWVMYTPIAHSISREGNTVTLTAPGGETLSMDFLSNQTGEFVESTNGVAYSAAPWSLAPTVSGQNSNSDSKTGYKRIAFKVPNATGDLTITVKMTPGNVDKNAVPGVDEYGDVDSWDVNGSVTIPKTEKLTGDVTKTGKLKVGEVLSVSVSNCNCPEENLLYVWQTGLDLNGYRGPNYVVRQEDVGKYLTCFIVDKTGKYEGELAARYNQAQAGETSELPITMKHNVEFDNNIAMHYVIPKSELTGYTNLRLVVSKDVYEKNNDNKERITTWQYVLNNPESYQMNGVEYWHFTFPGIAASEMGNKLVATAYFEKNGKKYVSQADEYSVKAYAYARLSKSSSASYKKALVDMLNYGAAAQTHFGKNEANPVNAGLTDAQKAYGTPLEDFSVTSCEKLIPLANGQTASFEKKNLLYATNVVLAYRMDFSNFKKDAAAGITEAEKMANVKVVFKYNNGKGEKTLTVPFSKFTTSDGKYVANCDCLTPAEMGCVVNATIYDGAMPISGTLQYSIETYVSNRLAESGSNTYKDLMKKMILYGRSVKAHFK